MKRELAREVARLAWPVILQGLLSTAVFFTDRLLLGSYSDAALGSMQISGPVLWSMAAVLGAFSAGTMAIIGRSVGAKDPERVRDTLVTSLWLSVVVGGLMFGVGMVLTRGCISRLTVLTASGNLRALTVVVIFAIAVGIICRS